MKKLQTTFSANVNDMPAGIEFTLQGQISLEICPLLEIVIQITMQ